MTSLTVGSALLTHTGADYAYMFECIVGFTEAINGEGVCYPAADASLPALESAAESVSASVSGERQHFCRRVRSCFYANAASSDVAAFLYRYYPERRKGGAKSIPRSVKLIVSHILTYSNNKLAVSLLQRLTLAVSQYQNTTNGRSESLSGREIGTRIRFARWGRAGSRRKSWRRRSVYPRCL